MDRQRSLPAGRGTGQFLPVRLQEIHGKQFMRWKSQKGVCLNAVLERKYWWGQGLNGVWRVTFRVRGGSERRLGGDLSGEGCL